MIDAYGAVLAGNILFFLIMISVYIHQHIQAFENLIVIAWCMLGSFLLGIATNNIYALRVMRKVGFKLVKVKKEERE